MGVAFSTAVLSHAFDASYAIRKDEVYNSGQSAMRAITTGKRFGGTDSGIISEEAIARIAAAHLGERDKESLLRMAAYIDTAHAGDPAMVRDLMTLIRAMEMGSASNNAFVMSPNDARAAYDALRQEARQPGQTLMIEASQRAAHTPDALGATDQTINQAQTMGQLTEAFTQLQEILGGGNPFGGPVDILA